MKKDRKILIKYFAIMICSCMVGAVIGFISAVMDTDIRGVLMVVSEFFVRKSPYLMYFNLALMVVAFSYYIKGKKLANDVLAGDEEKYEAADRMLELALEWTNYVNIYSFLIFGVLASGAYSVFGLIANFVAVLRAVIEFVVCLIGLVFLQRAIVNLTKRLNPEKKGDVLDMKFRNEWFDSCDEAEKAQIGAAAWASFKATTKAIVAMWVICVFAGFLLPVGPLPSVAVSAIWFVQTYSYMKAARDMNK